VIQDKLSSDIGDSGSRKFKRGYGGACGGVWRSLESGGRFCVGAFGRNLASVAVKMFFAFKSLHTLCTFCAICKNNAVNCITVQQKGLFPSNLSDKNNEDLTAVISRREVISSKLLLSTF
jgi:hypothetical protein